MKELVCQVLKGLFVTGWLCVGQQEALATTYYASPSATSTTPCTDIAAPCSVAGGIAKLSAGDDVLELLSGFYQTDKYSVTNKNGTSGHPIIIQPYHYGLADEATVTIEGTGSTTWTRCSTCTISDNVACQGLLPPAATTRSVCDDYYYFYGGTGTQKRALFCTKLDGTPCYRLANVGAGGKGKMTNAHTGYISTVCSTHIWIKCNTATDCPTSGETCGGNVLEVDSTSQEIDGGYIVARWGDETPGFVSHTSSGNGFVMCGSDYITIRGFHFRNFRRATVQSIASGCSSASDFNTISNNTFAYSFDTNGSDRPIETIDVTGTVIDSNYVAYAGSEAVHAQPKVGGSDITISNNFIRDGGDHNVLGTRTDNGVFGANPGTPNCMTLSYTLTNNDFTGSEIYGNICLRNHKQGIAVEKSTGWSIHDNIIIDSGRSSIRFFTDATGGGPITAGNAYNNIVYGCCTHSNIDAAIQVRQSGQALGGVSFFNNTIIRSANSSPQIFGDGTLTDIIFRNNLLYQPADTPLVMWVATDTSNKFDHNLFFSPNNSNMVCMHAATYSSCSGGTFFGCNAIGLDTTDLDMDGSASEGNRCEDPGFYDSRKSVFLFYPTGGPTNLFPASFLSNSLFGGPVIDAGTSTGMPASKTTGIVNSLAAAHGLGFYSDSIPQTGSAWDIGAVEAIVSQNLTDWTATSNCAGGAGTVTALNPGFKFTEDSSGSVTCSKISISTAALTAGHNYLVTTRLEDAGEENGGSACVGATLSRWGLYDPTDPLTAAPTLSATTGRVFGAFPRHFTVTGASINPITLSTTGSGNCVGGVVEYLIKPVLVIPQ